MGERFRPVGGVGTRWPYEHPHPCVSLVNDFEIIVKGLERMLEPYSDRVRVVDLEAGGVPDNAADVVLFDTFAGRRRSLERVRDIAIRPRLGRIVLYTWDAPTKFLDDVEAEQVDAVILKSQTALSVVETLERVVRGERVGLELLDGDSSAKPTLTEREREVLALIARGATNPQIARELYLSVDTVKTHVRSVFRKLDVSNRTQAAMAAKDYDLDLVR
ncbi:MAG: response regulator transcription factor [Ilumatobacteraceae bacterium]